MNQPSPRPWRNNYDGAVYDADGHLLFVMNGTETDLKTDASNASLVVRTVNSHEKLLEWARKLVIQLRFDTSINYGVRERSVAQLSADIKEAEEI